MTTRPLLAGMAALALGVAGCGASKSPNAANPNAPEKNPAGDIPDTQVYVRSTVPGGGYTIKVPEGWSRQTAGSAVVFTDHLNTVRLEARPARGTSTIARRRAELSRLAHSVRGFKAGSVSTVTRPAGRAVRITYQASGSPNAVTGKAAVDAVERYLFFHGGREVIVTLSGPKSADNVDPWRTITTSLRWTA